MGLVPGPARVVARIVAVHRVNGKDIHLLADLGRGHPMVLVDGIVIEQPGDVHGLIALGNGALHGHRVAKVGRFIPELKGADVGWYLEDSFKIELGESGSSISVPPKDLQNCLCYI